MLTPISCYGCGKHLCDVKGKFKLTLENVIQHHTSFEIFVVCPDCGNKAAKAITPKKEPDPFTQILEENDLI